VAQVDKKSSPTFTLEAMRGRTAALMASHGTLTVGDDLDQAVDRARRLPLRR
jgi:ribulose-5-phosphate 4-epimerase/fuculose-1-phosphate aldolase